MVGSDIRGCGVGSIPYRRERPFGGGGCGGAAAPRRRGGAYGGERGGGCAARGGMGEVRCRISLPDLHRRPQGRFQSGAAVRGGFGRGGCMPSGAVCAASGPYGLPRLVGAAARGAPDGGAGLQLRQRPLLDGGRLSGLARRAACRCSPPHNHGDGTQGGGHGAPARRADGPGGAE